MMENNNFNSCDVFNLFDEHWALVTAGNINNFNGCTIGWGSLGNLWGNRKGSKKAITIYIHPTRYTAEFLLNEEYFTVSFFPEIYRKDLSLLGSKTGRNYPKFADTSISPKQYNNCVIFEEASLTFICKKLYWNQFNKMHLAPEILNDYYNKRQLEPHYQFIGEILDTF